MNTIPRGHNAAFNCGREAMQQDTKMLELEIEVGFLRAENAFLRGELAKVKGTQPSEWENQPESEANA